MFRRTAAPSLAASFAVCLAGAACTGSDAPERTRTSGQAIVGGTHDTAHASAVLVIIEHAKNPTADTSFMCTGAVIAPHVILTAAHCLDETFIGTGQSFYAFYGDDAMDPAQLNVRSNFGYVKSVTKHPDFDATKISATTQAPADIGVVVLETPAPVPPLAIQREKLTNDVVGKDLLVVGYGKSDPADASSSGRRSNDTRPVVGLEDSFLISESADHSLCEGDSGGPSFLGDVIVGVHSWVEHATSCTGKNYDTRVDAYADWVDGMVRAADPGFLPDPAPDAGDEDAEAVDDAAPPDAPDTSSPRVVSSTKSGGCAAATTSSPSALASTLLLIIVGAVSRRRRAVRPAG